MKNIVIKRDDIFPDWSEELEEKLKKLKNKFGIEIQFLFSEGLSISYDSTRWLADNRRSGGSLVIFKDQKSKLDLLYLKNKPDRIALCFSDDSELLTFKKYTEE